MEEFLSQTLHGVTLGSLFALVAVGYTMVFGIIKLINFAHGEFYMAGGFAGLLALAVLAAKDGPLAGAPGWSLLLVALLAAGICVALLAVFTERLCYRPVRNAGRISALLTAVGVSLLLQNGFISIFGGIEKPFPRVVETQRYPRTAVALDSLQAGQVAPQSMSYQNVFRDRQGNPLLDPSGRPLTAMVTLAEAGEAIDAKKLDRARKDKPEVIYAYPAVTVNNKQLIIFASLAVTALGLYLLVQRTRAGRAMRAVSHDFQAASLMGIDTGRIIALTFAVGGAVAGLGGVLTGGMVIGTVNPMMGFLFGLKAFVAAVLGGIGNIPGAMLGGLLIGLVEQYSQHYADAIFFKGASAYRDAIAFLILIAVLLIRPTGLLGRAGGEKV